MDAILEFFRQDMLSLVLGLFIVMSGIISMVSMIERFSQIIGKPVRWIRNKNFDHSMLQQSIDKITLLQSQQEEDRKQSIRHDKIIREDLQKLTHTVDNIVMTLDHMQAKANETELKKLKDSLVRYYNTYKKIGKWSELEKDAFWDLFDEYEARGGDGFIHSIVEPVMRELITEEFDNE